MNIRFKGEAYLESVCTITSYSFQTLHKESHSIRVKSEIEPTLHRTFNGM